MSEQYSDQKSSSSLKMTNKKVDEVNEHTKTICVLLYKEVGKKWQAHGHRQMEEIFNSKWKFDELPTNDHLAELSIHGKLKAHMVRSPNLSSFKYEPRRKFLTDMLAITNGGKRKQGYGNPDKLPSWWPSSVPWIREGVHNLMGHMHQLLIRTAYEHYYLHINVGEIQNSDDGEENVPVEDDIEFQDVADSNMDFEPEVILTEGISSLEEASSGTEPMDCNDLFDDHSDGDPINHEQTIVAATSSVPDPVSDAHYGNSNVTESTDEQALIASASTALGTASDIRDQPEKGLEIGTRRSKRNTRQYKK